MLNSDMIKGVVLSLGKADFHIERNENSGIGYRTRLRLNIRADSFVFLEEIQRGLNRMGIETTLKEKEHSSRPRPILRIGGIINLYKLMEGIPESCPDAKNEWARFRKAVEIVGERRHLTEEGITELFELKGVL